ncbi:MAG: C39 family peptidase [Candidatus Gracilibacteria bacterium]
MKKNILLLIVFVGITSCSFIVKEQFLSEAAEFDNILGGKILSDEINIVSVSGTGEIIEKKQVKEIKEKVSSSFVEIKETQVMENQKILDVKFYSQFPSYDFGLPFDEFCEEASLLNGIYFLTNRTPTKKEYLIDLDKIKEIEDKLFGVNGYKNTSIKQTNLVLQLFQNPDYVDNYLNTKTEEEKEELMKYLIQKTKNRKGILGKILYNPSINDLTSAIDKGNPVILPIYGRALNNKYFSQPGPIYHNILLKGYDKDNFIVNEVGTIKGDSFSYSKKVIIDNLHDYVVELYPDKYTLGDSKVLILYK